MGLSAYTLTEDKKFNMTLLATNTTTNKVGLYGTPSGMSATYHECPPGNYTVIAMERNNPDWIRVENENGDQGWINIGLSRENDVALPVDETDKMKLIDAIHDLSLSSYAGVVDDENYRLETSKELQDLLASYNTTVVSANLVDSYKGVGYTSHESVVQYSGATNQTLDEMYEHYLILAIKAYGAPPQWTPYVDPRIMSLNTGLGMSILVGRKFATTVMAAPTILSLSPGVVKYNSLLGAAFEGGVQDEDAIISNISAEASGRIIEFQPCWNRKVKKNYPYLSYVNTLNAVTAIAMSREEIKDDGESSSLKDRTFPGIGDPYYKFDWAKYDDPDNSIAGIFGSYSSADMSYELNNASEIASNFVSSISDSMDAYKYVNFFCSGSNSTKDSFDTSVRSTQVEDMINSQISSIVKDVTYFTGGLIGQGAMDDIKKWSDSLTDELGGIGSILKSATDIVSGGKIEFPAVVDDFTYGKECQFTVRFVAGSANVESRYLMRCEYNHLLALVLPRQLESDINMYACPYFVRAVCPGRYSCEIGVLTGFNVNYGGVDDNAWTVGFQPTEIEVTFGITPLYSKLYMSSYEQLHTYFLKNSGMIEYLVSNSGVDMRLSQLELKVDLIKGMAEGAIGRMPNNIVAPLFDNAVTNAIRQFVNF